MARSDWAQGAGLTTSEIKNYAIPILKRECSEFLTFQSWKVRHSEVKNLWISINEQAMYAAFEAKDSEALASGDYQADQPPNVLPFKPSKTSAFDHLKTVKTG